MSNLDVVLAERQKTHGDFKDHANLTQTLKCVMGNSQKWAGLNGSMRESLEMIAHKIGRILSGNPSHLDHWEDIAGYATLVANQIREQKAGSK